MRGTTGTAEQLDETARRILTPERLAALRAPLEEARSLPNEAYTDPAFLTLENARLFAPGWMLAGFGATLPEAGDAVPVNVAGLPAFLVRGDDGAVRAFQNVCPHRGTRLIDEPAAASR